MEKSEEAMSLSKFLRIIRGSKQFDFCGSVLEVIGYVSRYVTFCQVLFSHADG